MDVMVYYHCKDLTIYDDSENTSEENGDSHEMGDSKSFKDVNLNQLLNCDTNKCTPNCTYVIFLENRKKYIHVKFSKRVSFFTICTAFQTFFLYTYL